MNEELERAIEIERKLICHTNEMEEIMKSIEKVYNVHLSLGYYSSKGETRHFDMYEIRVLFPNGWQHIILIPYEALEFHKKENRLERIFEVIKENIKFVWLDILRKDK